MQPRKNVVASRDKLLANDACHFQFGLASGFSSPAQPWVFLLETVMSAGNIHKDDDA